MLDRTNRLVGKNRRLIAPASLAAVAVLSGVCLAHEAGLPPAAVHAAMVTASPLDDSSVSALTAVDHAMESLAARVTPAVVNVAVTARPDEQEANQGGADEQELPPGFAQFFGQGGQRAPQAQALQHGIGSGVIVSPDGYVVTNNHVVNGATQIKVTLHDRRVLTAKVVGTDKLTDLAVIKVDAHDLPAISWGDSTKLEPGQMVLAFGSPFGSLQFSVTRGIVSAINRQDPYAEDARKPGAFIQTDAAINPGNSGGPLVNSHGELVGINTSIITSSGSFAGAGFAIPAEIAKATTDQIIRTGSAHHGYIGISMNDVTPENAHFFNLKEAKGAIVTQVTPNSPASRAGLANGDVIQQLNGKDVLNGSALQVAIADVTPGTAVRFGVLRDGHAQTVALTLGEYSSKREMASKTGDAEDGPAQGGKLGLAMSDLTPQMRQQFHLPDDVKGAAIAGVRPGSPAEDAGLQPGDVIVQVNRHAVDSASQAVSNVHAIGKGQDVLLLIWSRGGESYRVVHPDQG